MDAGGYDLRAAGLIVEDAKARQMAGLSYWDLREMLFYVCKIVTRYKWHESFRPVCFKAT